LGITGGKLAVSLAILVVTIAITWSYGSGHWGIKLYEVLLKCIVALIVVCFFVVVWSLSREGQIDWGGLLGGFIPSPGTVLTPAPALQEKLDLIANPEMKEFWTAEIVQSQRDKVIAAAATAVGINMTFLFPYTLLRKGWTKEYRGLQVFDLTTGMFIPFVIATSCVVIAAASQFHAQPVPGLVVGADGTAGEGVATDREKSEFVGRMRKRLLLENPAANEFEGGGLDAAIAALPAEEQLIGAMLIDRDANRLARALEPATGDAAKWLFGVGVLGMTLSTITLLMLISGFVLCEIFNLPPTGWALRLCCLPGALGALGPFVWSKAQFALAVPTSIFGFMLLPLAYLTFFVLMNQRTLLGSEMPTGGRRVAWNILMGIAAGVAAYASITEVVTRQPFWGPIALGVLLVLVAIGQVYRWRNPVRAE
jgi:Mn2+/Fe2+ NRAMP family transporter